MKVYELFNGYESEDFTENVKFSCHGWIMKCIKNINLTPKIAFENSSWINTKDIVGKYNAPNFLLEVFSFYQSKRFRDYPKNRDYLIDFSIILYFLLKNDADLTIKDYEGKNFIVNLIKVFSSQEKVSWKKSHKFLNNNTFSLVNHLALKKKTST